MLHANSISTNKAVSLCVPHSVVAQSLQPQLVYIHKPNSTLLSFNTLPSLSPQTGFVTHKDPEQLNIRQVLVLGEYLGCNMSTKMYAE